MWVFALLALGGCPSDDKTTGTGDTGTATAPVDTCEPDVEAAFPEDGDTDAYYRTDVRFTLSDPDPTATIAVADAAGASVNGTTTVEGSVVSWSGDDLAPDTAYVATLTYTCGTDTTEFTTSSTGAPTGVDVTGKVYILNLSDGNWIQPAGLGKVLPTLIGDYEILVSPVVVGTDTIDMLAGVALEGEQDECAPTIPFPSAAYTDPFFRLTADELPLVVADVQIDITNLELSGAFSPDGARIQGAVMKGKIDSRPLAEAFNFGTSDLAGCNALAAFGVVCEECDNGAGPYCVTINIDDLEAVEVATPLDPITAEEIAKNPSCVTPSR